VRQHVAIEHCIRTAACGTYAARQNVAGEQASESAKVQTVCICFYVLSVRKEQGTTVLVGDVRILLRILLVGP
jgi:hypothetical protein